MGHIIEVKLFNLLMHSTLTICPFTGQFDWNTKHGKGIYTWPNGNEYKGDFFHEKLHGKGEMKYIMGHR